MKNADILIGDVVLANIKGIGSVEVVAIAPPRQYFENGSPLFLFPDKTYCPFKFLIDQEYLNDTPEVPKEYFGWYAARISAQDIIELVDHSKYIGDVIRVRCEIHNEQILKFSKPSRLDLPIMEFEIIGRVFNRVAWQYEYPVKLPDGSPARIMIHERDLELWGIEDRSLLGSLFRGVLKSEIVTDNCCRSAGMTCMNKYYREFCPLADSPNCPNDIFLCYRCRSNPVTYITVTEGYVK